MGVMLFVMMNLIFIYVREQIILLLRNEYQSRILFLDS